MKLNKLITIGLVPLLLVSCADDKTALKKEMAEQFLEFNSELYDAYLNGGFQAYIDIEQFDSSVDSDRPIRHEQYDVYKTKGVEGKFDGLFFRTTTTPQNTYAYGKYNGRNTDETYVLAEDWYVVSQDKYDPIKPMTSIAHLMTIGFMFAFAVRKDTNTIEDIEKSLKFGDVDQELVFEYKGISSFHEYHVNFAVHQISTYSVKGAEMINSTNYILNVSVFNGERPYLHDYTEIPTRFNYPFNVL